MRIVLLPLASLALIGAGDPATEDKPSYDETEILVLNSDDQRGYRLRQAPEQFEVQTTKAVAPKGMVAMIDESGSSPLSNSPACSDQITNANALIPLESDAEPQLQREPASPDRPHAIYAVDRREAGCSLMVLMGSGEARPLPLPTDEPLQVTPVLAEE